MSYKIIHICCSLDEDGHIVGKLHFVNVRTIILNMCTVVDIPVIRNESNSFRPIESLLSYVCVRLIARISCQACTDVKETAVRDRILVIKAFEIWIHLPPQPAILSKALSENEDVDTHPPLQSCISILVTCVLNTACARANHCG